MGDESPPLVRSSHLDWREPIGLQERLEGRSSHNGEILRDVSFPLSGNRGYDSNRSGFPSPSTVITAPRDAPLYHSVTAHAHRKTIVCSNNAPTRKVYVTLVYLFLFAVVLMC